LADPNTRTGKRTPVTLKIKFKSETLEQFIERYAVDVSQGGIFIRTKEPLAVGTQMRFEFQLRDASPLIGGEGTVVWTRENDPSRPAIAPGMGVRFDRLAEGSQGVLERILAEKAKQAPHRPASESIKPPLFTDTPTRVAPAPIQEELLREYAKKREAAVAATVPRRDDDQHTPLPKPMPFATDADEFPDEAFEEATKVRALDELVAATAEQAEPADELASRRPGPLAAAGSEVGTGRSPFGDIESIPRLPSPPEPELPAAAASKGGRLLDASPSPRSEPPSLRPAPPSTPPPLQSSGAKTKLGFGLEAPPMPTPSAVPLGGATPGSGPTVGGPMSQSLGGSTARPVPAESTMPTHRPTAKGGSGASLAILIVVLLAAGAAGVWFFVLRDKGGGGTGPGSQVASGVVPPGPGSDKIVPPGPGSDKIVPPGPGSDKVETPKAPLVETIIDASVPKSRIEVAGTDQKGEAPFTAKLEKDKSYKVRISSPGYVTLEIDLVGGAPKHTAALVPKPRVIAFKTDPVGALVSIDNVVNTKLTPVEIELTKAQVAAKSVRVRVAKKGFKPIDKKMAIDAFVEDEARMVATIDEKMQAEQVIIRPPPGTGSGTQTGSGGTGDGSSTPTGGSATPPPPPPPPGDGSAAPAGGGGGSAGTSQ